jgi:hypothetical protein
MLAAATHSAPTDSASAPSPQSLAAPLQPLAPAGPSHGSTPTLTHAFIAPPNATLDRFLALSEVRRRYAAEPAAYTAAFALLRTAQSELERFKLRTATSSDASRLPHALQLNVVKRAKLTPVAGQPAFYATETAELERIEREASTSIYATLLKAKEKHVTHLTAHASMHSFILRHTEQYRDYVTRYAVDYNTQIGAPAPAAPDAAAASASTSSTAFPTDAAVAHFARHLDTEISSLVLLSVEEERQRRETAAQAAAQEHAAQEQVLAGAQSGQTITMLANNALEKKLAPLQQQVRHLQQQQAHTQRTDRSHAPRNDRGQQHRTTQPERAHGHRTPSSSTPSPSSTAPAAMTPTAASHRPDRNTNKRHRDASPTQLHISAHGDRRHVSATTHAGHTGNQRTNNSAPAARSKNAKGGDRRPPQARNAPAHTPSHTQPKANHANNHGRGRN